MLQLRMLVHLLLPCVLLPQLLLSLPLPDPKAEARAHTGLIALDSAYVLPLLLAGAAFAKVRGSTIQIKLNIFRATYLGT